MRLLGAVLTFAALAAVAPIQAQQSPPQKPTPNLAQWRAHHDQLVATARSLPGSASLVDLMRPMLMLAESRSRAAGAADELRAALLTLTFYVNGWPIAALVPEAQQWPTPARRSISLRGRGDLAQHFTVSALVASMAGEPLAAMIGLYKELRDARGGSGFSFSDLAADHAGTLFGKLAGSSDESARQLHAKVAGGLAEADVMPTITGLPDNLSDAEFTRRYGGVGGEGYNSLVADIAARVNALRLFN